MIGERLCGVSSCMGSGPDAEIMQVQLQQAQNSHNKTSRCTAELLLSLRVHHVENTEKISEMKSSLQ